MTEAGTLTALVLTIMIFSFLYRENRFYRFAEYLLVGVSVGYFFVIICKNSLYPLALNPLMHGDMVALIPTALGLTMLTRLNSRWASVSRIPLSLMIGFGAGISIPAMLQARVLKQLSASMNSLATVDGIIIVIGIVSTTMYFYFSQKHEGVFGRVARLGTLFLMVFFGATFGYTVMSRISLLIGRLEFIMRDALGVLT
jgi:hypothetical protein